MLLRSYIGIIVWHESSPVAALGVVTAQVHWCAQILKSNGAMMMSCNS